MLAPLFRLSALTGRKIKRVIFTQVYFESSVVSAPTVHKYESFHMASGNLNLGYGHMLNKPKQEVFWR